MGVTVASYARQGDQQLLPGQLKAGVQADSVGNVNLDHTALGQLQGTGLDGLFGNFNLNGHSIQTMGGYSNGYQNVLSAQNIVVADQVQQFCRERCACNPVEVWDRVVTLSYTSDAAKWKDLRAELGQYIYQQCRMQPTAEQWLNELCVAPNNMGDPADLNRPAQAHGTGERTPASSDAAAGLSPSDGVLAPAPKPKAGESYSPSAIGESTAPVRIPIIESDAPGAANGLLVGNAIGGGEFISPIRPEVGAAGPEQPEELPGDPIMSPCQFNIVGAPTPTQVDANNDRNANRPAGDSQGGSPSDQNTPPQIGGGGGQGGGGKGKGNLNPVEVAQGQPYGQVAMGGQPDGSCPLCKDIAEYNRRGQYNFQESVGQIVAERANGSQALAEQSKKPFQRFLPRVRNQQQKSAPDTFALLNNAAANGVGKKNATPNGTPFDLRPVVQ